MKPEELVTQWRKKYPEYNYLTDEELAKAIFKKYPVYGNYVELPGVNTQQYYPGPYRHIEFPEPEEEGEDEGFWKGLVRSLFKSSVDIAGQTGGLVGNILGTIPEGQAQTFTGYPVPGIGDVKADEVPEPYKYNG